MADGRGLGARNIVLVGFMGTGKSSTGRILAERLGREFVDMDAVIESREGRTISRIFAESGEPYFRSLERSLTRELAARENLVIAPGGGIVLNPDNVADFSATGYVICLRASPEQIYARIRTETHRPLLHGEDPLGKIRDLLAKRAALYAAIPLQLDTDGLTPAATADRVLARLNAA